jgi:two-component system, sensor histidine kinase SagS
MKFTILVVDDEVLITDDVKIEINNRDPEIEVICCNSGYDALFEIMQGKLNLLLTDIAMPDMDGYELYSRAIELKPDLPVIMMTGFGYDPNHAVVKSRKDGLEDVIFKPFDYDQLLKLIYKKIGLE